VDGKTKDFVNQAVVKMNMSGISNGTEFYRRFCNPGRTDADTQLAIAATPNQAAIPGFPDPVLASNDSVVTMYYLDSPGLTDVAVIYISGFDPSIPRVFQRTVDLFFQYCRIDGKKKIIVDLQMNGGGYIFQGYDLFRQFFPEIQEEGFNRWRETEQFMAMAEIYSEASAKIDPFTHPDPDAVNIWESWWNYRYDYNESLRHFESFDAKFAPRKYKGDPYTALLRWNFNDSLTTINSTFGLGIDVTGYGSRINYTQPYYKAEDIIMLTDGYCASTCSLFSSMMKGLGGVKTVAIGGRPVNIPMQGVGGVKGAQVLSFDQIWNTTREIIKLNGTLTKVSKAQESSLLKLTNLPMKRSTSSRLNVRDQILRGNLEDGTAAQVVYEPADCKLSVTYNMLRDVEEIWKAAAMSAWYGAKCVAGTGFPNSSAANFKGGKGKRDPEPEWDESNGALSAPRRSRIQKRAKQVVTMEDVGLTPSSPELRIDLSKFNQRVTFN
jgi:hypothetical protein